MPLRTSIAALVLVCVLPLTARAQDEEPERERALELFRQSADHYQEGRFGVAAELLREAYELHPEPVLLYNLGRALDGMGDFAGAVRAYRGYIEAVPDAEDRGAVERRAATLETYLESGEEPDDARPGDPGLPQAPPPSAGGGINTGSLIAAIVIGGVGAAGLGTGALLGLMAQSKHDEAVDDPVHVTAAETADEADSLAAGANIAFVAGGILLAVGVTWAVLEIVGSDSGEQDPNLAVTFGPTGATFLGTF